MKQTIKQAIAGSSADFTEVRIERRWLNRVLFQREKLETLASATELGGVVRCLKNGGWGISVFNDPTKLAEHVREATQMAAVVGAAVTQPVILADVPTIEDEVRAELEHDFRTVPLR